MDTIVSKVTDDNLQEVANKAAEILRAKGLVSVPTETVYGLMGDAYSDEVSEKIFEAKGRPSDNPFIVHICDLVMLQSVVSEIPDSAVELAKRFWPGPLTMIMHKNKGISDKATCGLDTVAVRMPSNPVAQAVIQAAGLPLSGPSSNLSGRPSPTSAAHVIDDLNGRIPMIIDGGPCTIGVESTVISLVGEVPTILRPGIISLEEIREILPNAVVSHAVTEDIKEGEVVLSPGMKYKHYSPFADVYLVKGRFEKYCEYVKEHAQSDAYAMCFDGEEELVGIPSISYGPQDDPEAQAKKLYKTLRAFDKFGAAVVFARCPNSTGKSLSVYNRMIRASGFKVIVLE